MNRITIAGGTGDLGGRVIEQLVARAAQVVALVRPGTPTEKRTKIEKAGGMITEIDLSNEAALARVLEGSGCVVSTLQGLRDVIVDAQARLLAAAVRAGVPRFIPSDFSSDFSQSPRGDNRNFDLRRELHDRLEAEAGIAPTTIYNGAFAEILAYNTPLLDRSARRVAYWGSPDWRIDFTTKADTAAFTAAAACDSSTPRALRIASFQISPQELAALATELGGEPYELVRKGSVDELAASNRRERAANPAGESEVFPRWQQSQYMHSMLSTRMDPLDNARYPALTWTGARELLASLLADGGRSSR